MTIYIAADHRGFALKETLKEELKKDGYALIDLGDATNVSDDDYPDFAAAVGAKVGAEGASGGDVRGIVICGSGFGVDIVANKFKGVRSALAMSPEHIRAGRHDDDVNVLSIAADFIAPEKALEIARVFLRTAFDKEERYARRLGEIAAIEDK